MENRTLIEIDKLVKVYDSRLGPALDGVSLKVEEGDIFGILGPNGAGKTTLISILCKLKDATSGSVLINGHSLKDAANSIKKISGVVAQDIALYDKLTAFENLSYFGTLGGYPPAALKERISALMQRMGLEKFMHSRVGTFSGGMKRRVNLLAGVLHDPKILYLDEPTVGLDIQSRNTILDFLKEINASGTTIIYTSHMMDEVEKLCTRVAIIDYGKVIALGPPATLIKDTPGARNLEDVFLALTGHALRDD